MTARLGYNKPVRSDVVPVLEIGGTHVTAALVDVAAWTVSSVARLAVDADGPADVVLTRFAQAAAGVPAAHGAVWGVAMPDPFDYRRGIGLFEGVGKYAALHGVDVGDGLRRRIPARPAALRFLNDADAFVLGEWIHGAVKGAPRCAGITLGTGIGSGWLVDGAIADPGSPPGGRLHRMSVGGRPLEDTVSRRAIRRAYAAAGGDPDADVHHITESAGQGDRVARRVLDDAFVALGRVLGPCLAGFRAEVLVVGGSMAASWDLFAPAFRAGAEGSGLPEIRMAADAEHAPLIGAAAYATR